MKGRHVVPLIAHAEASHRWVQLNDRFEDTVFTQAPEGRNTQSILIGGELLAGHAHHQQRSTQTRRLNLKVHSAVEYYSNQLHRITLVQGVTLQSILQ